MKILSKLFIMFSAISLLTACGPEGPTAEQLAAEQQAKAVYETIKTDYQKYKEWRSKANNAINAMNSAVKQIMAEKDAQKVIVIYENSAKELNTVVDNLNNMQFADARFAPLKSKGIEGFKLLADLMQESSKYITQDTPDDIRKDMIARRTQAVNIINKELGALEDGVVKDLNAEAKKYDELRRQNSVKK